MWRAAKMSCSFQSRASHDTEPAQRGGSRARQRLRDTLPVSARDMRLRRHCVVQREQDPKDKPIDVCTNREALSSPELPGTQEPS